MGGNPLDSSISMPKEIQLEKCRLNIAAKTIIYVLSSSVKKGFQTLMKKASEF